MPFDGNTNQFELRDGTIRTMPIYTTRWRDGLTSLRTLQQQVEQIEKQYPKQDVQTNLEGKWEHKEGAFRYDDMFVSDRFIAQYCKNGPNHVINTVRHFATVDPDFALLILNKIAPKRVGFLRVQSLGNGQKVIRAVNSEYFTRLLDSEILRGIISENPELADRNTVVDSRIRDNDFFVRMLKQEAEIELRKPMACVGISHAELGGKALRIEGTMWTPICTNGMVRNKKESSWKKIHKGDMSFGFQSMLPKFIEEANELIKVWSHLNRVAIVSAEQESIPKRFRELSPEARLLTKTGLFTRQAVQKIIELKTSPKIAGSNAAALLDQITLWAQSTNERLTNERKAEKVSLLMTESEQFYTPSWAKSLKHRTTQRAIIA